MASKKPTPEHGSQYSEKRNTYHAHIVLDYGNEQFDGEVAPFEFFWKDENGRYILDDAGKGITRKGWRVQQRVGDFLLMINIMEHRSIAPSGVRYVDDLIGAVEGETNPKVLEGIRQALAKYTSAKKPVGESGKRTASELLTLAGIVPPANTDEQS